MYYQIGNFHHFTPFLAPWSGFADGVAIRANRIPSHLAPRKIDVILLLSKKTKPLI
ncbi:hypothetical protein [Nostoc sphaeroides]|uniref:Uncharacterized protein n=1 Tax=Nostoc sphaeroides CCNUC1 TaxID=2653204 RepID=A0A5P8WFT5_9NOSO|nr:hypothetical protein [Nostoc sphaeroides]QFS51431.1 hypothetical protein GXM_08925 [Nostoc sphaeroides CCNUC1]